MTAFQRIARHLWSAYQRFIADDGPRLAAAMAYYVALSFFPLLMILVAGLSVVMAGTPAGQDVQRRLLAVVQQQTSPVLSEQIEAALATINRRADRRTRRLPAFARHFGRDFHPIRVGVRSDLVDAGRS